MNLTLQHAPPTVRGLQCEHCDGEITAVEDFKYVRFNLGKNRLNFHENCFDAVLTALNKFDQVFLKDRLGERGKRVH